ncbi:MBL fold metallo-hydrolase [Paenibacillus albiflavus]|uniref:MBL fold metallo-hydrolase n=1 Tax=Paenibacillus albiflavus TaxID=2545760 RepID=A0A4R4EA32_9BACL|nr:MBL fold metallo-hydrolase [Paenibacillus albiflavus]TCZ76077.1 MBL fold metallo-hydrolase [Paenibacillus albiflavus]
MKVNIIASGSDGNCIHIQSGDTGILIDAGKWKRDIEKRLLARGINASTDIQAIFVTHAHGDHIRGLTLANKYNIPVYATEGEWRGISGVKDEVKHTLHTLYGKYEMIWIWNMNIYPFKVHHDAYEPVGYAIEDDYGNRCCVVFDTGHIDQDMLEMMEGNIYIVESNYDEAMLENGTYSDYLKARIASDIGHLSNDQTAVALAKLVHGNGERIYLTHLSSNNNMPALAEMTVKRALRQRGFELGKHYFLEVVGC